MGQVDCQSHDTMRAVSACRARPSSRLAVSVLPVGSGLAERDEPTVDAADESHADNPDAVGIVLGPDAGEAVGDHRAGDIAALDRQVVPQ